MKNAFLLCHIGSAGSQVLRKTLENILEEEYHNPLQRLEIKLVDASSSEFKNTLSTSYKLYVKYQVHVHHDKEEDLSVEQFKRFLVKSPLQVLLHGIASYLLVTYFMSH